MKKVLELIIRINNSMRWIVGLLILLMGILVCYSVIMRYIFKSPPIWAFDLTSWFTGLSVFLAGGYALLMKSHVRVDLIYDKFSLKTRSIIDIFTSVFLFLIVIVFVWKGFEQVVDNFQAKTIARSGLNIYLWIKWLMVPVGGLLLGLQAVVNLINDIYFLYKGVRLTEEVEN